MQPCKADDDDNDDKHAGRCLSSMNLDHLWTKAAGEIGFSRQSWSSTRLFSSSAPEPLNNPQLYH